MTPTSGIQSDIRDWVSFFVPSLPVAQPRQRTRAFVVNGVARAQNYTPTNAPVNAFKASVRHEAMAAGAKLLNGPVLLSLDFVFARPKRMIWKTKPMLSVPHVSRPDFDNLAKAICDALTGIAWRDDAQISRWIGQKRYAGGDETPGVRILIDRDWYGQMG